MSVRALAAVAVLLLVPCIAAPLRLLDPLGWWRPAPPSGWTFVNPTLSVARGQRVILQPMQEGEATLRYTFFAEVREPSTDDQVAPVPHLRASVEELNGDVWEYRSADAVALCQLGALSGHEWLVEIGPVEERGGPRGPRTLLRAAFGHRDGSQVSYYWDPAKGAVPALGWIRREMMGQEGGIPEILYASDGGVTELPPPKPK